MPQSYAKRRRREAALARLRAIARHDLSQAAAEVDIEPTAHEADTLVGTAVRFADPYLCSDRDALLPAHRGDLRRGFFRRCLRGEAVAYPERLALAREMAPSPDAWSPPGRGPIGFREVTYNQALQAFRSQHRRSARGAA